MNNNDIPNLGPGVFVRRLEIPYNRYYVYSNGTVWANSHLNLIGKKENRGHFLSPFLTNTGYLSVHLYAHNQCKNMLVHRLVAMCFVPNPFRCNIVNHIDGNKLNNNFQNLEWTTQKNNLFSAQLQNRMVDRSVHPYIVTNILTAECWTSKSLKTIFENIIRKPGAYAYHSLKYKKARLEFGEAVEYKFENWIIRRCVDITMSLH